eukprot:gene1133-1237_t
MQANLSELLRLALTLSFTSYLPSSPSSLGSTSASSTTASFSAKDFKAQLLLVREQLLQVPSAPTAWTESSDYAWVRSLSPMKSVLTTSSEDGEGDGAVERVPDLKCDLFHHTAQDLLVLSFRGTHSLENHLNNLRYFQEPLHSLFSPTAEEAVHGGFQAAYLSLREEIMPVLQTFMKKHKKVKTVLCVGHSLGGALATLAALDLKVSGEAAEVQVITFGAPPVGNQLFATYAEGQISQYVRVVNRQDPVPISLDVAHRGASWLGHEHEEFVHVTGQLINLQTDALKTVGKILSSVYTQYTSTVNVEQTKEGKPSLFSSLVGGVFQEVQDQHGLVCYLVNLENYLSHLAQGEEPSDPHETYKAVASHAWKAAGWAYSAWSSSADDGKSEKKN